MRHLDTDVLIVGAGPCGMMLANLLGVYGVRAVIIDREADVIDFPRAVGIDDESLRSCQAAGVVSDVLQDCVQNTPIRYHTSWGRCFAHVKPSAQPFGWPRRNLFLQPRFEETMRAAVTRFPHIDVRLSHELTALEQHQRGVTATVIDATGETMTLGARYVVGTDGGRSTVRRLVGIELVGETAPTKWLVVDVADDELDAPYAAVYCDPDHPVLVVPLPYRHRRWEFKLSDVDDEAEAVDPKRILERLRPHYAGVELPTVVSSRVYLHHSRIAERFREGRVFIGGDAAHLQPPFFGQGMNSGMRDVTNLAWKLAAVMDGRTGSEVLDTYDLERRAHAAEMVWFATRIGKLYTPRNRMSEYARDLLFRGLQFVPGGKDYVLQMKFKPMPHYRAGVVIGADERSRGTHPGGRMFGQPAVETVDRRRLKLDDALGPWFAVIGNGIDPTQHLSAQQRQWWATLGAQMVKVVSPRLRSPGRSVPIDDPDGTNDLLTLFDVDGGFRDLLLARPMDEIVVLRPDRYVAMVSGSAGFDQASSQLRALLGNPTSTGSS